MKRLLLTAVLPAAVSGCIMYLLVTRTHLPQSYAGAIGCILNGTLWGVMSNYFPKELKADTDTANQADCP